MWTCVNATLDILDLHARRRRANLLGIAQEMVDASLLISVNVQVAGLDLVAQSMTVMLLANVPTRVSALDLMFANVLEDTKVLIAVLWWIARI